MCTIQGNENPLHYIFTNRLKIVRPCSRGINARAGQAWQKVHFGYWAKTFEYVSSLHSQYDRLICLSAVEDYKKLISPACTAFTLHWHQVFTCFRVIRLQFPESTGSIHTSWPCHRCGCRDSTWPTRITPSFPFHPLLFFSNGTTPFEWRFTLNLCYWTLTARLAMEKWVRREDHESDT